MHVPVAELWQGAAYLRLSWKIEALGRRLGIPASAIWSKCWPYLLSRRGEAKKRGLCNKFGRETGHKHARDTAHVTRPVIDILNSSTDRELCRYTTEAEAAALAAKSGKISLASSKFRGRGVRGRGTGRTPGRGASKGRGDKGTGAFPSSSRGVAAIGRGRGGEADTEVVEIEGAAGDFDYFSDPIC